MSLGSDTYSMTNLQLRPCRLIFIVCVCASSDDTAKRHTALEPAHMHLGTQSEAGVQAVHYTVAGHCNFAVAVAGKVSMQLAIRCELHN